MSPPQDWTELSRRIIAANAVGDSYDALIALAEGFFEIPEETDEEHPILTSERLLARVALRAATGKNDAIELNAPALGTSQRTFWRYYRVMSMPEFQHQFRRIFWLVFQIGQRRFGFGRKGFDVLIDETLPSVFGECRKFLKDGYGKRLDGASPEDELLTELGLVAGASKLDKYSGKFRALTFQVMVARCRCSGAIVPLDVVLVATNHPLLVGDLEIPGRSKEWIIGHFIGLLQAAYPVPRLILFDKGYHAHQNYHALTEYCQRYGSAYMTPAPSDGGHVQDRDGNSYKDLDRFVERMYAHAKQIPGCGVRFVIGKRAISGSKHVRTLLTFYHQKSARKSPDLPEGSIPVGKEYYACSFYVSDPNPLPRIAWWERIYSRRWCEENWFRSRSTTFHDGRAHKIQRRCFIFMLGILCLAIYALARMILYPDEDTPALSRHFNVKQFADALLTSLSAG